jgi:hypothetical protein
MPDIEIIAAAIHEAYRASSRAEGWTMRPHLDRPYAELATPDKDENRAAASRMEDVLTAGGLALSDDPGTPRVTDDVFTAALEAMAEAEHNGWMAHRAENGWTWGETRDDAARRHPSMMPYAQLPESEKEKDRVNVRHYQEIAGRAGYRIVRSN